MNAQAHNLTLGSMWRRWDPHIHAPGTTLNDQFGSADAWETYLSAIEASDPKIEALGVTDYYLLDTYREVLQHKVNSRLADVTTIFPNIELRLTTRAANGFVNIHLLIDPTEDDHIEEAERFLGLLEFEAHGDIFKCSRDDLLRLGRKSMGADASEKALLAAGANQFKVEFNQLKNVYRKSDWAKKNILIAVAGGKDDGTSGLRQASDATLRAEIEKFAHIIFASSVAQREFWTGKRPAISVQGLKDRYDGCKPCLHGSDAHRPDEIGQPDNNRYSWVKGAATFDALRQACIDPEYRAFVADAPPAGALPSQVISSITVSGADWAISPTVPLNPGLVTVIGARGSGKTALADIIAAACDAVPPAVWSDSGDALQTPSFLARARPSRGAAARASTAHLMDLTPDNCPPIPARAISPNNLSRIFVRPPASPMAWSMRSNASSIRRMIQTVPMAPPTSASFETKIRTASGNLGIGRKLPLLTCPTTSPPSWRTRPKSPA